MNGFTYISDTKNQEDTLDFKQKLKETITFLGEDQPKTQTTKIGNNQFKTEVFGISDEACNIMACYEKAVFTF
jgi:hypothetical protein